MATQEMTFTKGALDKAAHNGGQATRYRDARYPNLYLEVGTRSKTWRYRKFWKGQNFTETLGTWPNMGVIEAAQTAAEINQRVEETGITRHDDRRRNAPEITLRVALEQHCTQALDPRQRKVSGVFDVRDDGTLVCPNSRPLAGPNLPRENSGQEVLIAQASPNLTGNFDSAIKESFEKVIDLFAGFDLISGDLIYRQLSQEQLGDLLVRFLVSLGVYSNEDIAAELKSGKSVNGERDALQTLSNDISVLSRSETHVCARFVQWLNAERPELAAKLSNFVAAGLLAELVEDFRKPSTMETKSTTTFFLDGPMLLGLVGTSGTALQEEARTIVAALKSIGCQVQVFSESCREAERVLVSYLKASPSDRHGRTHTAVLKREVDRAYVQVVAADVEKAAQKFGVGVRDYSLEAYPNDHSFFDKDRNTDIYSYLAWENPLAREHDAFAVTAIMRMRRGKHKNDPLQNSHVFMAHRPAREVVRFV